MDLAPLLVLFGASLRRLQSLCRSQHREPTQIKARGLEGSVTEPPWLYGLRRLLIVSDALLGMVVHHRVLDCNVRDRSIPAVGKESGALFQLSPHFLQRAPLRWLAQPTHPAVAKPSTGRMHDSKEIPTAVQQVPNIADEVAIAAIISRKQIAGPGVEAEIEECTTHLPRSFTSNQDADF